jgi:hypothetical protein
LHHFRGIHNSSQCMLSSLSPFICLYTWNNWRTTRKIFVNRIMRKFVKLLQFRSNILYCSILLH